MKTRFLFPYYFKFIGLAVLFLAHIPIVRYVHFNGDTSPNGFYSPEHVFYLYNMVLIIAGLLMFAFSKEKIEDEQISQLRLDSLQWAVYLNYFLLMVSLVFATGWGISHVMQVNLWGPLVFFIIRFRWMLYRLNRSFNGEAN